MSSVTRSTARKLWVAALIAGLAGGVGISPVAASTPKHPNVAIVRHYASQTPFTNNTAQWTNAAQQANGSVVVSWSRIQGAAGYNIFRSTAAGTQGSQLNSSPVWSPTYVDSTAQAGTTYFYTVVALASRSTAPEALRSATTLPQVQALAYRTAGRASTVVAPGRTVKRYSLGNGFGASKATGTAKTAVKTARAAHPASALGSACIVALPHILDTGTETNFGCGTSASIVELLIAPSTPTVDASSAACPGGTTGNTDCDVHIGTNTVETITPGTTVYVASGQAEDAVPAASSIDPSQGVDIIVDPGGTLTADGTSTAGQQILFDSTNNMPGFGQGQPGDWGSIAYQGTAAAPALGSINWATVQNGGGVAAMDGPMSWGHDSFRNEAGNPPLDSDQYAAEDASALLVATDQPSATFTATWDSVAVRSGTFSDGIAFGQFSGGTGSPTANTMNVTATNTSVSGAEDAFSIVGRNDISSGAVGQTLNLNLIGDATPQAILDGALAVAEPFSSVSTDNGGDDNVVLNIQNSNLSGGQAPGLLVPAISNTGNATISGQVLGSTISGFGGGDLFPETGGAGNASIANLSVANSTLSTSSSDLDSPGLAAWNDGDFFEEAPAAAFGSGTATITPTFTGDNFSGSAGGLFNWSYTAGAGDSTDAPTVTGASMDDPGYPFVLEADATGAGMAHVGGTMSNSSLTASDFIPYASGAFSNTGAAVDDPTLSGLGITAQDDYGASFNDQSHGSAPLTSSPTIQNSTIDSSNGDAVHQTPTQFGAGTITVGTSVVNSSLSANTFGGALYIKGYTYSTNASNPEVVEPSVTGSTLTSSGLPAADVEAWAGISPQADITAAPTFTASTLKGLDDSSGDVAVGVLSEAWNDGNGAATSTPTISGTDITSGDRSLDDFSITYGAGTATSSPTINEDSTLTRGSNPDSDAIEAAAVTEGSGDAVSLPTIQSSTVSAQGFRSVASAASGGNAHSGGTYTDSTFSAGGFDDAFDSFSYANNHNASGDAPTSITDPSFDHDNIGSTNGSGIVATANGEGNPASVDNVQGAVDATITATNTNVVAEALGMSAQATDSDNGDTTSGTTYTSDLEATNDSVTTTNQTEFDAAYDSFAEDDYTTGLADAVSNITASNGTAVGPASHTEADGGVLGGTGATQIDATKSGTGGNSLNSTESTAEAEFALGWSGAGTANINESDYTFNSPLGVDLESASDIYASEVAGPQPDPSDMNLSLSGINNKGGNGVFVGDFGGSVSDTEGTVDGLTESNLNPFFSGAAFEVETSSANGDVGNVAVTHSTISDVGGESSGIEMVSFSPDASTPPVAWLSGDMLYNFGADVVNLQGFVPEVVGNSIWGADQSPLKSSGVYVDFNTGTSSFRHLTAKRPIPNPELQGVVDANFIWANNVGVTLDADNLVNPDVRYNDFAGPTLTSGNPVGDLIVNNLAPATATQDWWGSTDTTLGGDVDNSCFSAAIGGGCLEDGSSVTVLPIMTSPRMTSGFVMDAYGGLHPYGGADPATAANGPYWPGWPIARAVATDSDGLGGQVLDGWGGLHPFGTATQITNGPYWPGWDIARSVALLPGDDTSGYVLDGWGGIHPFGSAPSVSGNSYYPGWDIMRAIVINPLTHSNQCVSGYTMDAFGGLHSFADEAAGDGCSASNLPAVPAGAAYWPGWAIARGIGLSAYGQGYTLDGWGGVHPFGGAPAVATSAYWYGWDIARSITVNTLGSGYVLDGWGGVHPFGISPPVPISGYWPGWDVAKGID